MIPEGYLAAPIAGATLWTRVDAPEPVLAGVVAKAIDDVTRLLDLRRRRALHVVIYGSREDSRRALGRVVSPTALLAPLHTASRAVIVAHAPAIDPLNGDRRRMLRHLCHEVAHVCVAERTGSTKRLGDDDAGMRVRPWLDEGFAECAAALAADRPDVIERALAAAPDFASLDEIDAALRDLDSPRRSAAFAAATTRVWRAVEQHGIRRVLDQLDAPDAWP